MNKKFNIGDKVKVREDLVGGRVYGGLTLYSGMAELKGRVLTIRCKEGDSGYGVKESAFYFNDEMLVEYTDAKVIFNEKATVLIKDGKKYVSKCKDGDTYDKEKGLLLCLAQANGISYRDLQEMIDGAKDCNAEKAKGLAGKIATGLVEAVKAFKKSFNGAKADDKAQVREVKRGAKEGEYIKIVKACDARERYKNGDILKVKETCWSGDVRTHYEGVGNVGQQGYNYINYAEYVVLENYKPYKITLSEFWGSKDRLAIHCKNEEEVVRLHKTMLKKGFRNKAKDEQISLRELYTLNDKNCICVAINQSRGMLDAKVVYEFNEVDLEN